MGTYNTLAHIATAQGRAEEAAQWLRKEQDSYAAYAGSAHEIRDWAPVIQLVVAAYKGNTQAAQQAETALQGFEEGWPTTVAAVRQILVGERDIEVLRQGLSTKAYVVVHTILAQLSGAASGISQPADASDAIARIRQQWAGNVAAVVAACQGDAQAAAQVAPWLDHIEQQDDWRALAAVLRRILAGERDADALLAGLDTTDALIAGDVLRGLGAAAESDAAEDEPEEQGLTLDQLLDLVAQACRPDAPADLAAQLHGFTRGLAADANQPAEIQALGRILNAILSGERAPDLSALPEGLAGAVGGMLTGM